jgi:signal recognition particle receptor subunit beta
MPNINYVTKSLAIKIIYYGPGLSGKTTNLRYIYNHLNKDSRGEFLCLETPSERTLFFDLLPVKAGMIREFETHFHLMTVPGQVFLEASRKSVLKGADGIVFVADSQVPLLDANLENFNGLKKNLLQNDIDINLVPLVFQYNKRDLENLIPVDAFNRLFNSMDAPFVESSALYGNGVFETLSEIAKQVVPRVKEKIFWEKIKTDVDDVMKRKFVVTNGQMIIKREKIVTIEPGEDQLQMKKIKFKSQKDVDMEIEKLQKDFLD